MNKLIFTKSLPFIRLSKSGKVITPQDYKKNRTLYQARSVKSVMATYQIADIRAAILQAQKAEDPDRSRLWAIYDYIYLDSNLKHQIRTARMKVTSRLYGLYKADVLQEEQTKLIETKWFKDIICFILEAEFYGFSLIEIIADSTLKTCVVRNIPRINVAPDRGDILIEGTLDGKFIHFEGMEDMLEVLFFGSKTDLGLLLHSCYNTLYKFYDRGDWSRYNEKVGIPLLSMKINSNDPKELDAAESRAGSFGSDGYIVSQSGDEVVMIERKLADGHKSFKEHIEYNDTENSRLINGQTGTADAKSFVGSAEVHERVLQDYSFDRMISVKFEINNKLIPYLIKKGFTFLNGLEFDFQILKELKKTPLLQVEQQTPSADPNNPAKLNHPEQEVFF